jgi:hypothetical protein
MGWSSKQFTASRLKSLLKEALKTRRWMLANIRDSRAKDYENPFRQMVYESQAEMEKVIGKLSDNSFILAQEEDMTAFEEKVEKLRKLIKD